ncbi:MAG: MogA/MoaB family molybdenum cofactor biosynthesis protein [Pyrinomonadaceae bacterium MAG19_C2-C3]|nr:MogA/MoaB family molybdenum cofactor biosynthesis protein [Pyrinomonadaceae bacterium MAG19_C2-C3]
MTNEHDTKQTLRVAVLTVSDRCARGEQIDKSGAVLAELVEAADGEVVARDVVSDDLEPLINHLKTLAARPDVDVIFTTGGTGFSPRDNTPEATRRVIQKEAPGLAEMMRFRTVDKTPTAVLSRAVCGIANGVLIINLPGSPGGVRECFAVVAPLLSHAIRMLRGESH